VTSWDEQAASFDDEPDHGLRDPEQYAAWQRLLAELLPGGTLRVADLGCGTGSLSLLLAAQGHDVVGIDSSSAMVERARAKARERDLAVSFVVDDASAPDLAAGAFDVVLARHVVWALPDAQAALRRWTDLLGPGGRMVLVEGYWYTGAGLRSSDLLAVLDDRLDARPVRRLDDPRLWGREITDERYAVLAELRGSA
jgi:SAM-dependent methyltransferase